MCVDYRQFNAITIKNRYTLFLIHEMQDKIKRSKIKRSKIKRSKIKRSKIFIKIDIRKGYYKIRIKKGKEWKII